MVDENRSAEEELVSVENEVTELEQEAAQAGVRQPTFYWAGRPVYECPVCGPRMQFVEDPEGLDAHIKKEHSPKLVPTGLVDANGAPISRQE